MATPGDFPPVVRDLIASKARQLARGTRDRNVDRADLHQELSSRVLRGLDRFESTRADFQAFVHLLVERAAADWWRVQMARKRWNATPTVSLSHPSLPDVADPKSDPPVDLTLDVADLIERLPEDLRTLAEHLSRDSIGETARILNLPRSTLQRAITRLRVIFESHGLGNSG
jgi:DNA-directed RNA polymerase specialized sigma24 family protein